MSKWVCPRLPYWVTDQGLESQNPDSVLFNSANMVFLLIQDPSPEDLVKVYMVTGWNEESDQEIEPFQLMWFPLQSQHWGSSVMKFWWSRIQVEYEYIHTIHSGWIHTSRIWGGVKGSGWEPSVQTCIPKHRYQKMGDKGQHQLHLFLLASSSCLLILIKPRINALSKGVINTHLCRF